ncbi:radical SAM protein [Dolichospermum lemmermannii CS-548]|uniref:radical SAM protein n=1 Tax=Dolichospermum lemmermannii TaxID=54295 RepID=UPI00232BFF34|nr:radical SAM protein [Dolichospermum lemmermannii]MDB9439571.1 radical SAM protein [Dolichospermum lemmermannii CS-548]
MSLAASKGGVYAKHNDAIGYDINIVRQWLSVGQKQITSYQLYQNLVETSGLIQLELGIGNTCGLECQHCFLGYESGTMISQLTPMPILLNTVTKMIEQMGTRLIAVTDRDALTPNRSIPLFEHIAKLRTKYPQIKMGGVTNGLAIDKYADNLEQIQLDYLDISLDGLRDEHDAIRGKGKFDLVLKNLRIAVNHQLAKRVIVATTLHRFNDDSVIKLIHKLIIEEEIQWFDIGLLMAVKMQNYQLQSKDIVVFLDSLSQSLQPIKISKSVTILVEICAYCAAFIPALIESGWLIPEKIRQDEYGHLYQNIHINDSITITLRPELIPEYWRHTLRISSDGYVVGGCEPLTQKDYTHLAVSNIQMEDIQNIYHKALAINSPFYHAIMSYDQSSCRHKACFSHCLGGDSLLAKAVYDDYNVKDPNCTWDEYQYKNMLNNEKYSTLCNGLVQ